MSGPEGSSIKNVRLCVMVFIKEEIIMDDREYMKVAYEEAMKARMSDEVPIGAIIVKDGEIIAQANNQKETLQDVSAHAEMLAIQKACQVLGTWHLDGCTLYSTLEPCMMCSGAIIQSRITRVVIGARGQRWHGLLQYLSSHEFNHKPEVETGILEEECSTLISNYFKTKRA